MKKRILCYGDSNTWGYIPGEGRRYDEHIRWTGILQQYLGQEYHIIEEGLNGRTTAFSDRIEPDRSGVEYIFPCLLSQFPLDMIIIMLGTNDTKRRYHVSPLEISYGLEELLLRINYTCNFKGEKPKILVVSPVLMKLDNTEGEFDYTSQEKSNQLARKFEKVAVAFDCEFLDARSIVKEIGNDGLHMTPEGHQQLGEAIIDIVKKRI